ncbi:MAG: hypothetical protein BWX69_01307 [Planctomycetes bacterium ADurb.Bin069]|jgi:hypothetical protein|nr:MAG: hypothetical protein BWX69_01307 [Planctomycetes bacterium ADurb.Bin069]
MSGFSASATFESRHARRMISANTPQLKEGAVLQCAVHGGQGQPGAQSGPLGGPRQAQGTTGHPRGWPWRPRAVVTQEPAAEAGRRLMDLGLSRARSWPVSGVSLLLSPPWAPGYNGTVEVAMYWLKTRIHHVAGRAGRGGALPGEDFASARTTAKEPSWPWRLRGRRPAVAWAGRPALAQALRRALGRAVVPPEGAPRDRIEGVPDKRGLGKASRVAPRRAPAASALFFVLRRPTTLHELSRKTANTK